MSFSISSSLTSSRVEQASAEAADDAETVEKADAAIRALQGDADFAIDQPDRQPARFGAVDRGFHLGAGLDAELLGEAALECRQRKIRGDEAGLALADDLEQIEIAKRFGIAQRTETRFAQLDGDRVERFALEHRAHGLGTRARNVRGAEQHELDIAAAHARDGLLGERRRRSRDGRGGLGHQFSFGSQSRNRLSRSS